MIISNIMYTVIITLAIAIIFAGIISTIYLIYIQKKYPFFGKIKTYTDVNGFIANIDTISFQDTDENDNLYQYIIENNKLNILSNVYKFPIGVDNSYDKIKIPIRVFVWEHKDAINKQLILNKEIERKVKEEKFLKKEQLLKLKQLDKIIRKSN
jgi:hypothetical protein